MRLGVEAALVDGTLVPGDVAVDGGVITAVGLDGHGQGIAAPGFADPVDELIDDQSILIGEGRRHALPFDARHLEAERDDQHGVDGG